MKIYISISSLETLKGKLLNEHVPSDVITAILKVVAEGQASKDPNAKVYALAMEKSYDEYGLDGIKSQIMYLLLYLKMWQGPDAITNKKILNKWSKS